jgi:uncharacterized protein with FMN-binding domain
VSEQTTMGLGSVCEESFAAATYDYTRRHRRQRSAEEAFAACLNCTYTQLFHCGHGRLQVTVTVSEGGVSAVETYFWKYRRVGQDAYVCLGGTIDL